MAYNTKDLNKWTKELLGAYAAYLLCNKYLVKKTPASTPRENKFNVYHIEGDKRRENTVRKALQDIGLIECFYGDLIVVHEKYLELAPSYEKEPQVMVGGLTEVPKYSSNNPEAIKDRKEKYLNLLNWDIPDSTLIYIQQHIEEYHIESYEEEVEYRRSTNINITENVSRLYAYPKNKLNTLQQNFFKENMRKKIRGDIGHALSLMTQKPNEALTHKRTELGDIMYSTPWIFSTKANKHIITKENIEKRIHKINDQMMFLNQALKELNAVKESFRDMNDEEYSALLESFYYNHLRRQAPLLIKSKDEATAKLSKMILTGEDKGIIIDIQKAEASNDNSILYERTA